MNDVTQATIKSLAATVIENTGCFDHDGKIFDPDAVAERNGKRSGALHQLADIALYDGVKYSPSVPKDRAVDLGIQFLTALSDGLPDGLSRAAFWSAIGDLAPHHA